MKKVLVIFLMLSYCLSSSGMTVKFHYCCGKLDGISFFGKTIDKCADGKHIKKSSCCKDEQVAASVSGEQQITNVDFSFQKQLSAFLQPNHITVKPFSKELTKNLFARGIPIPFSSIPLYKENCVFRL